jgi:hypothetical protein
MAVSTQVTTLSSGTDGSSYTKLVDITSYPDLGSAPSKLDTTDLSATKFKTSILGLQEVPDLTFEANYDKASYQAISAMTGNRYFKLTFGSGEGSFTWQGQVQVYANGAGVDEVRKMTLVLSASTPITFVA